MDVAVRQVKKPWMVLGYQSLGLVAEGSAGGAPWDSQVMVAYSWYLSQPKPP